MAEVGFYHLTRSSLDEALPPLLEKATSQGLRLVLVARDSEHLDHLDRWLWAFRPDSFLPHGTAATGFAAKQPIYLAPNVANPNGATVLVTVDGLLPDADAPFERVVDLFDGQDAAAVAAARERWISWRERGAKLVYWQQRPEGGWIKAREEAGKGREAQGKGREGVGKG
ncbi:MAG: DNA polymerase III subunit chi [Geminicoccaceae bacterium]|nr:MAG: DNA polymerase III subunit chi [Geminicoccaceae bacterium]